MKIIEGTQTTVKIFTDNVEDYAVAQIKMLCDNEVFKDCQVRVMPDVHPGKVGPIGFTSTVKDKIMPNIVGSDIGCGVTIAKIRDKHIEFQKLDKVIRERVPSGFNIRDTAPKHTYSFSDLHCINYIDVEKANRSLGTLGGGNHFIEVDKDNEGNLYLAVHSGSRYLGKQITNYYLNEGQKELKRKGIDIPYELTYLEGELMKNYIDDAHIATMFAIMNRDEIISEIIRKMKFKNASYDMYNDCIHNFIEVTYNEMSPFIIRKGAICASKDNKVIIPINMRDGIILGTGLGNSDWNYSAPHGAGRIMNRENVKNNFTLSQFKSEMKGIYSSCINKDTLDEAPFAYRGLEEIKEAISDTVSIDKILKPVYNFKAGKEK